MMFDAGILRNDERAVFALRSLYSGFGYSPYRMRRFEEYSIYAENKNFLAETDIITFTDTSGRLLALRPDVTISIVRSAIEASGLTKLYYNENVYRPDRHNREFRERMQAGIECIGCLDYSHMAEVIYLAQKSLSMLGKNVCLDVSHIGFTEGVMESVGLSPLLKTKLLKLIGEKNLPEISKFADKHNLSAEFCSKIQELTSLYGTYSDVLPALAKLSSNEKTKSALNDLECIFAALKVLSNNSGLNSCSTKLDFSIINDLSYYSGIVFQGFMEEVPEKILSGGSYDKLLHKLGKNSAALGFAVYIDLLPHNGE